MKFYNFNRYQNRLKGGFSLVEATFSIGVLSFGFLSLIPLLALGTKTARLAHDNRATVQIAENLIEEARQGTLSPGTLHLDAQGNPCPVAQTIYTVQAVLKPISDSPMTGTETASPTWLTLRITPTGSPDHPRIYAVIFSAPY